MPSSLFRGANNLIDEPKKTSPPNVYPSTRHALCTYYYQVSNLQNQYFDGKITFSGFLSPFLKSRFLQLVGKVGVNKHRSSSQILFIILETKWMILRCRSLKILVSAQISISFTQYQPAGTVNLPAMRDKFHFRCYFFSLSQL